MKKTLTGVFALLAGAFVAHSQGTVSLGNFGVLNSYIYVSFKPTTGSAVPVGGSSTTTSGNAATDVGNGGDWTVALYGAAGNNATTLVQLMTPASTPATAAFERGSGSDTVAGTWATTTYGVVPGTTGNGSAATVQLYAWYNNGGTINSYATAAVRGFSAVANTTTGGPNTSGPDSTATPLPAGITSFTVSGVPEPSTIALGVMGASGMLLRLRRKK